MLARPGILVVGPLVLRESGYGVVEHHQLRYSVLWSPFFGQQLVRVRDVLLKGGQATVPIFPDCNMDEGFEKLALSVSGGGELILHTIWFPARNKAYMQGLKDGSKTWRGSEEKKSSWLPNHATKIVFKKGLASFGELVQNICTLAPYTVASTFQGAMLSNSIFEKITSKENVGEDFSTELLRKQARKNVKKWVKDFMEDTAKLDVEPCKALPEAKSMLDDFVLTSLAENSLPLNYAQKTKTDLRNGAYLFRALFDLRLFLYVSEDKFNDYFVCEERKIRDARKGDHFRDDDFSQTARGLSDEGSWEKSLLFESDDDDDAEVAGDDGGVDNDDDGDIDEGERVNNPKEGDSSKRLRGGEPAKSQASAGTKKRLKKN